MITGTGYSPGGSDGHDQGNINDGPNLSVDHSLSTDPDASTVSVFQDTLDIEFPLVTQSAFDGNDGLACTYLPLMSYPLASWDLSTVAPFAFLDPFHPTPSIGCNDAQAADFHRSVFAPLKSTRNASSSSHCLFLDLAAHDCTALHFLLAFSYSELAIHQGYSHCPPLESYRHFQQGSWLFGQAITNSNPMGVMIVFLYLYMFWMRRDGLDIAKLSELSSVVLLYVKRFALDDMCAESTSGALPDSQSALLSLIMTYIYDRDVFCGFFGSSAAFAGFVSCNHEKRRRIWQLSRSPLSTLHHAPTALHGASWHEYEVEHREAVDVYFTLITIQHDIDCLSQDDSVQVSRLEASIQRKLNTVREVSTKMVDMTLGSFTN
jgi:hypothetical protein